MANNQNNSQRTSDQVTFDILEHIGVLSINTNREPAWTKEVNIVSWNGGRAKIDVREWNHEHNRMSRGLTLLEDEAEKLAIMLAKKYNIEIQSEDIQSEEDDDMLIPQQLTPPAQSAVGVASA